MKKALLVLGGITVLTAVLYFFPTLYDVAAKYVVFGTLKIVLGYIATGIKYTLIVAVVILFAIIIARHRVEIKLFIDGFRSGPVNNFLDPDPIIVLIVLWAVVFLLLPFDIAGPIALVVGAYIAIGYVKVPNDKRVVVDFFGHPYKGRESGARWKDPLFGAMAFFPTNIVEFELPTMAGVWTKQDTVSLSDGKKRTYGTVNLGVLASFLFEYPKGDDLIKVVKLLPKPGIMIKKNIRRLNIETGVETLEEVEIEKAADVLEEPILDQVRNVGNGRNYMELLQNRTQFARDIMVALTAPITPQNPDSLIRRLVDEAGLREPKISIKHIDAPKRIRDEVTAEEAARLRLAGTILDAEGKRVTEREEGIGKAEAKKAMLDAIRSEPENIRIQSLLTLIDMAQGPATTIFPISTNLTNELSNVLGRSPDVNMSQALNLLNPAQRAELMRWITSQLGPQGGAP